MSGIEVHVRVRPNVERSVWATADTVVYSTSRQDMRFVYNKVHSAASTNATLFRSVEPLAHSAFDGRNVTVMAYGQTGSGKTHTMVGTKDDQGIISRTAKLLIDLCNQTPGAALFASYIEIYNETVRDLMSPGKGEVALRDGPDNSVIFDRGSTQIQSFSDFVVMAAQAETTRKYGVTDVNEHSSRSHIILTFELHRPGRSPSTINLVDLAGSESAAKANTDGALLREGGFINKSLLALGNVVDAIVDSRTHVPFRESKLTRILRNCLTGNGFTFIVCCVNPSPNNYDQTVASLRFTQRAMKIKTDPTQVIAMIPLLAYQLADEIKAEAAWFREKRAEVFEAAVADAYHFAHESVKEKYDNMVEEVGSAVATWDALKVTLIAREKIKAINSLRALESKTSDSGSRKNAVEDAEIASLKRLRDLESSIQDDRAKRRRLETTVGEKRLYASNVDSDAEFRIAEMRAKMCTAFDVLLEHEAEHRRRIIVDSRVSWRDIARQAAQLGDRGGAAGCRDEALAALRALLVAESARVNDLQLAVEVLDAPIEDVAVPPPAENPNTNSQTIDAPSPTPKGPSHHHHLAVNPRRPAESTTRRSTKPQPLAERPPWNAPQQRVSPNRRSLTPNISRTPQRGMTSKHGSKVIQTINVFQRSTPNGHREMTPTQSTDKLADVAKHSFPKSGVFDLENVVVGIAARRRLETATVVNRELFCEAKLSLCSSAKKGMTRKN